MVTWSDLGLGVLALAGVVAAGFGALMTFGAGMASSGNPEGERKGCTVAVAGLAVAVFAIWRLLI